MEWDQTSIEMVCLESCAENHTKPEQKLLIKTNNIEQNNSRHDVAINTKLKIKAQ